MNFTSWEFLAVFFPVSIVLFAITPGGSLRQYLLIGMSLVFYGVSGQSNLYVLLLSIIVNYSSGFFLTRNKTASQRLHLLVFCLAIVANLVCLAGFKWVASLTSDGQGFRTAQDILIPLALSFVTFQQIGFLYSCYKRQIKQVKIGEYLFFIAFFPQLVMGPIVRFQDMRDQLRAGKLDSFRLDNLAVGLSIFCFGLAKKMLLADQLFVPVNRVFEFAEYGSVATIDMWFAVIGFQLQLFLDFTAYADMAIGIARIFGIDLPINFDRAFKARDRFDLWRRWHITFAMFMRRHVFLPLVRKARFHIPVALAITGFLSGLWHGLGWSFVIWGLAQSALMLIIHYRNKILPRNIQLSAYRIVLAILITFVTNALLGVIFRTPTVDGFIQVYANLFVWHSYTLTPTLIGPNAWIGLLLCGFVVWVWPDTAQFFRRYWTALDIRPAGNRPRGYAAPAWIEFRLSIPWAVLTGVVVYLCLIMIPQSGRFIYVQF